MTALGNQINKSIFTYSLFPSVDRCIRFQPGKDTENADVRETVISGYPAITIHKEGVSVAACTLEDLNAILLVTGQGFSVDDVVRVAESVRLR